MALLPLPPRSTSASISVSGRFSSGALGLPDGLPD